MVVNWVTAVGILAITIVAISVILEDPYKKRKRGEGEGWFGDFDGDGGDGGGGD